jgi:hypothetical protein
MQAWATSSIRFSFAWTVSFAMSEITAKTDEWAISRHASTQPCGDGRRWNFLVIWRWIIESTSAVKMKIQALSFFRDGGHAAAPKAPTKRKIGMNAGAAARRLDSCRVPTPLPGRHSGEGRNLVKNTKFKVACIERMPE